MLALGSVAAVGLPVIVAVMVAADYHRVDQALVSFAYVGAVRCTRVRTGRRGRRRHDLRGTLARRLGKPCGAAAHDRLANGRVTK
jgi:hypothetical protein